MSTSCDISGRFHKHLWWWIDCGAGNALVPPANKTLPELMLTRIDVTILVYLGHTELNVPYETVLSNCRKIDLWHLLYSLYGIYQPKCWYHDDVIEWKHLPRYNGWVNNREAGDLRRHRTHHYVTVMQSGPVITQSGMISWPMQHDDYSENTSVGFEVKPPPPPPPPIPFWRFIGCLLWIFKKKKHLSEGPHCIRQLLFC